MRRRGSPYDAHVDAHAFATDCNPCDAHVDGHAFAPDHTPKPTVTTTPILGIGSTWVSSKGGMVIVYVPVGEFHVGSTEAEIDKVMAQCSDCKREWFIGELPQHNVYLDAYWIDRTEVTIAMYALCVAAGACTPPQDKVYYAGERITSVNGVQIDPNPRNSYYDNPTYADYPVIYVSWVQAKAYCGWAEGRLASEAEWEKAARGTDGRTYPWGEGIDCDKANYYGKDGSCMGDTRAVGSYPEGASVYGALDMTGNVSEWVADWYSENYYTNSPGQNPPGPDSGVYRVARGASLDYLDWSVRGACRYWRNPDHWTTNLGFRCAR